MFVTPDLPLAAFQDSTGHSHTSQLVVEIDEIASGSFRRKQPPGIRGTGYVVESLEAALWAFYNSDTFDEG